MKKILRLTLAAVLLLGILACCRQCVSGDTRPPETESTEETVSTTAPPETTVPEPAPTETIRPTEPSEAPDPTQATEATESTEPTQPQKPTESPGKQEEVEPTDPPETVPTQPATEPTAPPTPPAETEPVPTEPKETRPPATEPPATEPTESPAEAPTSPTQPTESAPTEPAGCQHDWMCIHHDEEGHWRAGIMCDCGWTVYGDPGELNTLWNAHSASYPPAESLFEHGGFGSMDEWIVDTPAYDEWVCRHCGEPKP